MENNTEQKYCSFRTAVKWGGNSIVLLNNVCELDEEFYPYEALLTGEEEDESPPEIFQYYITDLSDDTVEWSRKAFPDVTYHYSEKLGSWILLVTHYGTSWDYVATPYVGDLTIPKEEIERFKR